MAAQGIATARRVSAAIFVVPVWETLSPQDRRFLTAMAPDDTDTAVSDIAERTGMSPKQVSAYRGRLIDKGAAVATPVRTRQLRRSGHPRMAASLFPI